MCTIYGCIMIVQNTVTAADVECRDYNTDSVIMTVMFRI